MRHLTLEVIVDLQFHFLLKFWSFGLGDLCRYTIRSHLHNSISRYGHVTRRPSWIYKKCYLELQFGPKFPKPVQHLYIFMIHNLMTYLFFISQQNLIKKYQKITKLWIFFSIQANFFFLINLRKNAILHFTSISDNFFGILQ